MTETMAKRKRDSPVPLTRDQLQNAMKQRRVPRGTWLYTPNHGLAFELLCETLSVHDDIENVYKLTETYMTNMGLGGLCVYYDSPRDLVEKFMPNDQ